MHINLIKKYFNTYLFYGISELLTQAEKLCYLGLFFWAEVKKIASSLGRGMDHTSRSLPLLHFLSSLT